MVLKNRIRNSKFKVMKTMGVGKRTSADAPGVLGRQAGRKQIRKIQIRFEYSEIQGIKDKRFKKLKTADSKK